MAGLLEMIDATVETAFINSTGEGERLNERFNFSKVGEVCFGGFGNK